MRYLYSLLLYLAMPFILFRLIYKSRDRLEQVKRLKERFGFIPPIESKEVIWVHAVSLGEVIAATPLIEAILAIYPNHQVVITTMTATGSNRVKRIFRDRVLHYYVSYDLPGAITRFLSRTNPQMAIIVETELWPNMIHFCHRIGAPTVLVNARLSEASYRGYKRFSQTTSEMLRSFAHIACQSEETLTRFIKLGAVPANISVTGSIKFDITVPDEISATAGTLRERLGKDRLIWIAASTHKGEDEIILDALQKLKQNNNKLLLILVPRHPERFEQVKELVKSYDYEFVLRTDNKDCANNTDVFIGNTIGELLLFYAVSDIAFVGGSFSATGGHNVLEPALFNLPIITGPSTFNFEEICNLMLQEDALVKVQDGAELVRVMNSLLQDEKERARLGTNANRVLNKNRGAIAKHLEIIKKILG